MDDRKGDEGARFYATVRNEVWQRLPNRGLEYYLRAHEGSELDWIAAALNAADKREKEGV